MSKPITFDYRDSLARVGSRHRITGEMEAIPEPHIILHTQAEQLQLF